MKRNLLRPIDLVVVIAPVLLVGAAAMRGLVPLGFDVLPFFAPLLRMTTEMLHAGALPVWTDRLGLGYPLLASVQVPWMYPLLWPLLRSSVPHLLISAYLLAHLSIAAVGGVWMARAHGLSSWRAWIVGVLCGAGLPVMGLLNRPEFVAAMAWAPWTFGAARMGASRILGASLGVCAAVSPQMAGAHAVIAFVLGFRRHRPSIASLAWLLLFAAPTLIPFLEFLPWSDRASGAVSARYPLEPYQVLQFISPWILDVWPHGMGLSLEPIDALPSGLSSLLWLSGVSAGPLCTVFCVVGVLAFRRGRRPGVMLAVCLLLALPPLHVLWTIPPLSFVRFSAKAWQAAWPLFALCCGFGLAALRRHGSSITRAFIGLGGLCALIAALPTIGEFTMTALGTTPAVAEYLGGFIRPAFILSALLCACAVAARATQRGRFMALLVTTEILLSGAGGADYTDYPEPGPSDAAAKLRESASVDTPRIASEWSTDNPVSARWVRGISRRGQARMEKRAAAWNAPLEHHMALEHPWAGIKLAASERLRGVLADRRDARMQLFGLDALLIGSAWSGAPGLRRATDVPEAGVAVHVPVEKPARARIARRVFTGVEHLEDPDFSTSLDATVMTPLPPLHGTGTVTELSRTQREVTLRTELDGDALVFTTDAHGPGWRVLVDGVAAEMVPVHGLLRGVVVGAGTHEVRFEHRARSLVVGLLVSGLCALWLGVSRRRTRP